MKTLLLCIVVLLGSNYIYSQVAKVQFLDGTFGYSLNIPRANTDVGDTVMFESLDQKVWQIAKRCDTNLVAKQGIIQKVIFYKPDYEDTYANFNFVSVDTTKTKKKIKHDSVDDWMVRIFDVGDTIQVFQTVDANDEKVYKIYFGQLPGKKAEEAIAVTITEIKY